MNNDSVSAAAAPCFLRSHVLPSTQPRTSTAPWNAPASTSLSATGSLRPTASLSDPSSSTHASQAPSGPDAESGIHWGLANAAFPTELHEMPPFWVPWAPTSPPLAQSHAAARGKRPTLSLLPVLPPYSSEKMLLLLRRAWWTVPRRLPKLIFSVRNTKAIHFSNELYCHLGKCVCLLHTE